MSWISSIKRAWQVHFGQADERVLYRAFSELNVSRWCEIGIGDGQRTLRLIKLLKTSRKPDELFFCGVDPFEARQAFGQPAGLKLKEAHCQFKEAGIKVQLVPGDAFTALSRNANSVRDLQAVIINDDQQGESLDRAMFYLPRMLSPNAKVFFTDPTIKEGYRLISKEELTTLSARPRATATRRAA